MFQSRLFMTSLYASLYKFFLLLTLGCFIFVSTLYANNANSMKNVATQNHPAKTELSKKAEHLKVGMSKEQVVNLLGKPTWADKDIGVPLTLAWRNGDCNPVVVTFDKRMKVDGWDEGRAECFDTAYTDLPDDKFLCNNVGRSDMCMATTVV